MAKDNTTTEPEVPDVALDDEDAGDALGDSLATVLIHSMLDGARPLPGDLNEAVAEVLALLPKGASKKYGAAVRRAVSLLAEAHATHRATLFALAELVAAHTAHTRVVAAAAMVGLVGDDDLPALAEIINETAGLGLDLGGN